MRRQGFSMKQQGGAALVVGLVVLAVVTVLGIASMQSSNTELKLASSMRDRAVTFEAAEAALVMIEKQLKDATPPRLSLVSDCSLNACFNPSCDGGLCFDGSFDSNDLSIYCEVAANASASERINFWDDASLNVWGDAAKHKTLLVSGLDNPVKYITEFLCYVQRSKKIPFDADSEANMRNGSALFRVTVLAEGNGGRSKVSLQSTYKAI